MDVWWGGDGYYLVDGHHRIEAYKAAKWPTAQHVPVAVYQGTLTQALLKAGLGNTPDKLAMDYEEWAKTEADRLEGVLREALGAVRLNQRSPLADALSRKAQGETLVSVETPGIPQEGTERSHVTIFKGLRGDALRPRHSGKC